jgi:hypothetical protein
MHDSEIRIERNTNSTVQTLTDLNALFMMVSYVELELARIAPECTLAASSLLCSISNEILSRNPTWICLVDPSLMTREEGDI